MRYTISAGGIVINPLGSILLIDQGSSWSLPKGHLHKNENPLNAAKREIFEESGITDLTFIKELGSYKRHKIDDPNEIKTIQMFLFRTNQIKLVQSKSKTHIRSAWVQKEKVAELLTHPKDKNFFLKISHQLTWE